MWELWSKWDTSALLYFNGLFPPSFDSFWLAVTGTLLWLPLYAALIVLLYRSSDLPTFIFRLALTALAVLLWHSGREYTNWLVLLSE